MTSPFSQLRAYQRYSRYQGYQGLPVERFGGLDLRGAVDEVGLSAAIDMLNVDLDKPGGIRSRDGYAKFTTAAAVTAYHSLAPYYKTDGTRHLIAVFGGGSGALNALNTSGGVVAAQTYVNSTYGSIARFSAPGSEYAYVAVSKATGAATIYRWDGTTWTTPTWVTTTPTGRHLATWQNRLANARYASTSNGNSVSTIRFSAISSATPPAATPETWGANDFVELSPGDGEEIAALIPWRDSLFAFKESKFFVFYGTSTDSSGNPIFNYRPIYGQGLASAGGQSSYRAVASAPDGVFFLNRRGVWFTSGGPAQLVSQAIDPIFRSGASSFYQGGTLNQGAINQVAMTWHDNRLYISFPSGSSTTNDKVLVYDPAANYWLLWDIPASAMSTFRISNADELAFAFSGSVSFLSAPTGVSVTTGTPGNYAGGDTRYFVVTALNANGETLASTEVSATTPGSDPSGNSFLISWSPVSGASSYRVYRGVTPGGETAYATVVGTSSYSDAGSGFTNFHAAPTSNTAAVNTAAVSTNDVGRYNITSGYTLDGGDGLTTGTAITSRYRSGFMATAGGAEARIREAVLQGSGTLTYQGATDYGSLNTGESVTLGTSPATAEGRPRASSFRGRNFSWQVGGTAPWILQRLTLMLAGSRGEVQE